MPLPTPPVITTPWARDAAGGQIQNPIPLAIDPTTGRASYELGFPPNTMQPITAGGKAPWGQDINGVLFAISSYCAYLQGGQLFKYSGAVATAIGGYAKGSVLAMADDTGAWLNQTAANSTDPDAGGAGWVPLYRYGYSSVGTTGGISTLTAADTSRAVIIVTGALVSNAILNFPNTYQRWLIVNATSGAFTLTVKTVAGSGVIIPQGGFGAPTEVYGNGTSLFPAVSPISIPTSVAAVANTIVMRDGSADAFVRFLNTGAPVQNLAISNMIYEYNSDGYMRKMSLAQVLAQGLLTQLGGQVSDAQVPLSAVNQYRTTILNDSALTGTPTAPTQAAGTNDTTVATTAFVQAAGLGGAGRVWQNVLGSRAFNTPFVNSLGYPINVAVSTLMNNSAGLVSAICDGVEVGRSSTNTSTGWMSISFSVAPGSTYQINWSGAQLGATWAEQF